ncbi:hypothetical protein PENSPDRAFT_654768 [Peniophora sp. CONT]|nr:hypothetical protein PENSPDRAFT_654768 [Peniophora sp. CONT]
MGAVGDYQHAEIVLQPCSSDLTTFKLSNGAPLPSTLIGLVDGPVGPGKPQPRLCITSPEGRAGNVPVAVQFCDESNQLSGWRINNGEGTGEIESTAPIMAAVCLTAVGKYQGASVSAFFSRDVLRCYYEVEC